MLVTQWELTKQGNVVLSWCALPDNYFKGEDKTHIGDQEGVKAIVDEVHLRKIDLADAVMVINIGGYIGQSTTNEVKYALSHGKPVIWLEHDKKPDWVKN
jgi:nucleoside 2-deoxyribosyltransferase